LWLGLVRLGYSEPAAELARRSAKGFAETGAAWKKTSDGGREYLSVKLDDPSFPAPIYASLVEIKAGPKS